VSLNELLSRVFVADECVELVLRQVREGHVRWCKDCVSFDTFSDGEKRNLLPLSNHRRFSHSVELTFVL
jgi:hypothetical protein